MKGCSSTWGGRKKVGPEGDGHGMQAEEANEGGWPAVSVLSKSKRSFGKCCRRGGVFPEELWRTICIQSHRNEARNN